MKDGRGGDGGKMGDCGDGRRGLKMGRECMIL